MDISQLELHSPGPVLGAITDGALDSATVAVSGNAQGLDHLLASNNLRNLWLSGATEAAADLVGSLTRLERLVIHDLRVRDLRWVARLVQLEELSIAGSPKLKSLAGLESLRKLHKLVLFDSCNYQDIERVAGLTTLDTLCLEGGFSKKLRFPTLRPVGELTGLRRLRLASLRVVDGSLRPLHSLHALREVFIAKAFAPAEFRALAAALPHVRGEFVDSFRVAG